MAAALRESLEPGLLTVVVNVGDDSERYGVHVAADPDTVLYTLAGVVGEQGWGRLSDSTVVMDELASFGIDTAFTLGDRDLAMCLTRTLLLDSGWSMSRTTHHLADTLGVDDVSIIPASDDPVRTWVRTGSGEWLPFQEYFVDRGHRDTVTALAFHGATEANPAPGVLEAIADADTVVIAPSNPPLSIWPILAIDEIRETVEAHANVAAVSPLFGGVPLKGPADAVMKGLGLSSGTQGVLEAYQGLLSRLFIDIADRDDATVGDEFGVDVFAMDTRLDRTSRRDLVRSLVGGSTDG